LLDCTLFGLFSLFLLGFVYRFLLGSFYCLLLSQYTGFMLYPLLGLVGTLHIVLSVMLNNARYLGQRLGAGRFFGARTPILTVPLSAGCAFSNPTV
jgi:hypothetical protein